MKKKLLGGITVLAIAAVAAFNININTQEDTLSAITLDNVEALASESGGKNTGPGQVVDCKGLGTGDKKVCLSSNSYPCSETSCF